MRSTKKTTIVITLILTFLLMMTTKIQAATVGKVTDLKSIKQDGTIYLVWSEASNADGYNIYINTSGKGYKYVGSTTRNSAGIIGFESNQTYTAKVCAYEKQSNGTKKEGNFSNETKIDVEIQEKKLEKVKNFTATVNGEFVSLNWDEVTGATGYEICVTRGTSGGSNAQKVNTTGAIIRGLTKGVTYKIDVKAYRYSNGSVIEYGEKSETKEITIGLDEKEITKPNKAKNLEAEVDENEVALTWDKANNATGYEVYLKEDDGSYEKYKSTTINKLTIKNLEYDTIYYAKILSYNEKNGKTVYADSYSTPVKFTTPEEKTAEIEKPEKVKNLKAEVDENEVALTWNKADNATGYEVYLKEDNGSYKKYKSTTINKLTIKNLEYDTIYYAKILSYNEKNGKTAYADSYSTSVKFTTPEEEKTAKIEKPGKVKNLKVEVDGYEVALTWDKADNATGYEVYLKEDNGSYKKYKSTTINKLTIKNLEYDTIYYAKILSYNEKNGKTVYADSYSSSKKFEIEQKEVSQVNNLSTSVKENTVSLSWKKVSGADGYDIWLAKEDENFKFNKTVTSNSTKIEDLDYNTTYKVKVRAYINVNGKEEQGKFSSVKQFTTKEYQLESASHLNAEVKHRNEAYINWWKVEGADGYEVYLSEEDGSYEKVLDTPLCSEILYDLEYKTEYRVKVRAYKENNGKKVYSNYSNIDKFKTEKYVKSEASPEIGRVKILKHHVEGSAAYIMWEEIPSVDGYEIEFTVPGIGGVTILRSNTYGIEIKGITNKESAYTARVRAYRTVNGVKEYGEYSYVVRFTGK